MLINAYQIFLEEYLGKSIINFLSFLKRHWEELKDGMPSNAIEGEPSHLEINSIFSPSMPILMSLNPSLNPSLTLINLFMLLLLNFIMTLGIHQDILRIGVMKIIGIPKKSNNNSRNAYNILKIHMLLSKNGWKKMKF